jgi:transposase
MAEKYELIHERVDDIPLLMGLTQRLRLPEILDKHLGNHGNHQGLSNGWLATVWMAYILSEGDHRMIGGGYEFERILSTQVSGQRVGWTERVPG